MSAWLARVFWIWPKGDYLPMDAVVRILRRRAWCDEHLEVVE